MHKSTSPNIYCPHTPGNSAGDLFAKPHTFKGWNRDLQGSGSIKMGHQWNHPAVEIFLCPHWRCIRIETPPATSMKVRRFSIWIFPKNRGIYPKMDDLSWKTLLKWMIWGCFPIFGNIHFRVFKCETRCRLIDRSGWSWPTGNVFLAAFCFTTSRRGSTGRWKRSRCQTFQKSDLWETKKTSSKCSTQNLQNYLEKTSLKTKPLEDKLVLHISSEAFHLISWELGKLSLHESFKYNGAWWKLTGPTCPRQWEDKPLVTGNRVKHPEFLLRPFVRHSIGTKAQCSWLLITIW